MMRITILLAGMALLAAPAVAKNQLSPSPDDLAVEAVHNFAACVADTTPKGAEQVLALDYSSKDYGERMRRLIRGHADGRCLSPSILRSNQLLLAGGMAERLVIATVNPARFVALVAYDASKPQIRAQSAGEMTAICVLRAEPAGSLAVFRTEPTSAEEAHAMQAIGPALVNCVKAGQTMKLNKPGLRAILALAAYRLTRADAVATSDGKPLTAGVVNQ